MAIYGAAPLYTAQAQKVCRFALDHQPAFRLLCRYKPACPFQVAYFGTLEKSKRRGRHLSQFAKAMEKRPMRPAAWCQAGGRPDCWFSLVHGWSKLLARVPLLRSGNRHFPSPLTKFLSLLALFFIFTFSFYWSIVDLQCCVSSGAQQSDCYIYIRLFPLVYIIIIFNYNPLKSFLDSFILKTLYLFCFNVSSAMNFNTINLFIYCGPS